MNPNELLRIIDAIHRDKNIDKEIVFQAIESALISAAKKHYGDEADIVITIGREDGSIAGTCDGKPLDSEETVGRIGAQTAKQVIIQRIREAERDALYNEYDEMIGQLVSGVIQRNEGGAATVSLGNVEGLLPRSEQIPGESHRVNERVRAVIFEVRKQGSRVKILLSRTRGQLVQRLFEQEIPEIAEGVISVERLAREPGYRSKVAVSSSDQRVDCIGACVGVRGNRIKNIVDELFQERIDIVRYDPEPQLLIPNALQPAEIEEVILCQMMGRAIVMVREDQLSLAIGRRGQNVRLASKLCGWDIEIMTREELEEQIERAVTGFSEIEGVTDEIAESLVGEGYLSYDDLSVIEPDALMEMGNLTAEQVDAIVTVAEKKAEEAERAAAVERRAQRERDRAERAAAKEEKQAESAETSESAETGESADTGESAESAQSEQADVPTAEQESDDESGTAEPAPALAEAVAEKVAEEPAEGAEETPVDQTKQETDQETETEKEGETEAKTEAKTETESVQEQVTVSGGNEQDTGADQTEDEPESVD